MKKLIMSAAILMIVCCDNAEATNKDDNIVNQVIKPSIVKPITDTVVLFLDDMTFEEAFSIEHRAKGEGHTFWWRGEEYTTDLAVLDEFVLKHVNTNALHQEWVTNNDDPDDNCTSNKLDDCGICDGPGKITWFRDKDGDGLGAFAEWVTSCTYPVDIEIKKD